MNSNSQNGGFKTSCECAELSEYVDWHFNDYILKALSLTKSYGALKSNFKVT